MWVGKISRQRWSFILRYSSDLRMQIFRAVRNERAKWNLRKWPCTFSVCTYHRVRHERVGIRCWFHPFSPGEGCRMSWSMTQSGSSPQRWHTKWSEPATLRYPPSFEETHEPPPCLFLLHPVSTLFRGTGAVRAGSAIHRATCPSTRTRGTEKVTDGTIDGDDTGDKVVSGSK